MSATPQFSPPGVWITVLDPESEDGRSGLAELDAQRPLQWAIPGPAKAGDLVLLWVAGGTGFGYLLQVDSARVARKDEYGPLQANLRLLESIQPSLAMPRLKGDPTLRSWWLVRNSMQNVVRLQRQSLASDPTWSAFLLLLESVSPTVAARLRSTAPATPSATPAPERETAATVEVLVLDESSTTPEHLPVTPRLAAILASAAAINEGRDAFDLAFSSLFLAIASGDDPTGRWLADYFDNQGVNVAHVYSRVGKDKDGVRNAARRAADDQAAILAKPLRRTVSARRALEEAQEIASAQQAGPVDIPHLVAALLSLTDYHEEDYGSLHLDRARWGAAFIQHTARLATDPADVEFWRRFYQRRFPDHELPPLDMVNRRGHRPDYDADAYTSRDLLAIEDEVAALAYVIAAKKTVPPLAIGLFGDWGSGKTFFMKHLRRRIDRLCEGARGQKPAQAVCHAHIAQIEFNAWHYQEGNLWASLVDHILRNLRFGENEEEARVAERRDAVVRELGQTETRQAAAAARATESQERVDRAEQRVAQLRVEQKTRQEELARQLTTGQIVTAARAATALDPSVRREGEALAQELGIDPLRRDATGLQDALTEARRELSGLWGFLVPLFRAKDRSRRVVLLVVAVVAPLVAGYVLKLVAADHEVLGAIVGTVAAIGSFVTGAQKWLRAQTDWVRGFRARLEPVAQAVDRTIDESIEEELGRHTQAIAEQLTELETLKQAQAEAQKEKVEAASQVAALRTNLAVMGEDGLMRAFLDERIGGGDYQKKLGVAALVRRDFDRLSRHIERVTEREGTGTLRERELVINRIVLYIDDLDRCDKEKVVSVLRAVHLLLAFPAFVVVVGVDSRWVARCLHHHLDEVFGDDQGEPQPRVTPLDYLEKIFQVPIWLEPVPPDRRVFMVRELLRNASSRAAATSADASPLPGEPPAAPPSSPPPMATQGREPEVADSARATPRGAEMGASPPVPAKPTAGRSEPPLDLDPIGLDITDGEYEFLGQMGGLLSASPRVIKRFVNTYRLINVGLAQVEIKDSGLPPRDSEIRMLLLAVLVGMPELSRLLQETLRRSVGSNLALTSLVEVMEDAVKSPGVASRVSAQRAAAEWKAVADWINERGEPWTSARAARFAEWLDHVGRYTFNLTGTPPGPTVPRATRD